MPNCLRFESFELNIRTGELRKDGHLIKLQDQPMKMLILLATRADELVGREEIQKELWSDSQFVEFEHGINTAVRKVREALGDDPDRPRFIETLPRKGYRFSAPVENRAAAPGPTAPGIDPAGDTGLVARHGSRAAGVCAVRLPGPIHCCALFLDFRPPLGTSEVDIVFDVDTKEYDELFASLLASPD